MNQESIIQARNYIGFPIPWSISKLLSNIASKAILKEMLIQTPLLHLTNNIFFWWKTNIIFKHRSQRQYKLYEQ
jgi:hypothetical protein